MTVKVIFQNLLNHGDTAWFVTILIKNDLNVFFEVFFHVAWFYIFLWNALKLSNNSMGKISPTSTKHLPIIALCFLAMTDST